MSANWGRKIELSIFGESHGPAIGINISGLPAGVTLDMQAIEAEMARRAPGGALATQRKEADKVNILSGTLNGVTTGAPLCAVIFNENQQSKDYSMLKELMRPGHSDYPAYVKYNGFNDVRGGGMFSGRLTAPLVFAGAIAKQLLAARGITIGAHIKSIYDVKDRAFDTEITADTLSALTSSPFPTLNPQVVLDMQQAILNAKEMNNSVGGSIQCAAIGLPAGLGDPFFDSVESTLSHLLFSIPGVKGVEFGTGFDLCTMVGNRANDSYYYDENGNVKCYTNHNGGVTGGITNGMPLVFTVALKPPSSIGLPQHTINVKTGENAILSVEGRHDACIVPRAVPVVEAVTALAILGII